MNNNEQVVHSEEFYLTISPYHQASLSLWKQNLYVYLKRRKFFFKKTEVLYLPASFIVCKGKGKIKSVTVLFVTLAPCYKYVLGEWKYSSVHSLTSTLDGSEWSASRPGRFTPTERAHDTHWIGGWLEPRAILDAMVKRN
jgi:hypothetical protein